jgi:single-strand DNA-binding protein
MAKSVNVITVSGNLGRDPEVSYTPAGMAVCKFSVAVNDRKKDGGDWKDATTWLRVTVFGKTAENAGQYLAKGKGVIVTGKLEVDTYKDKAGQERTSVGIVASDVVFMGGGKDAGGAHAAPKTEAAPSAGAVDDDLPFARFEPALWW